MWITLGDKMPEDNQGSLKKIGLWAGIATIVAGIVVLAQFLYSLYQNRVILNVSFQPNKIVYYCDNAQSDSNCMAEPAIKYINSIIAELVSKFPQSELLSYEVNNEKVSEAKKNFENSFRKFKIRVPLTILISNNGNRDTTITGAVINISGYKDKSYKISFDKLLRKVEANSTEKIELFGITFGEDKPIPGELIADSIFKEVVTLGGKIFEGESIDKYDHAFLSMVRNLAITKYNDNVVSGDIILKLFIEDQFGNRQIEELNISSLPNNLY